MMVSSVKIHRSIPVPVGIVVSDECIIPVGHTTSNHAVAMSFITFTEE